jgi:ABC-type oligopeptide transport system substrate-binding subunit
VRRQRRGAKLLALILGLSLIAAACGGDDDNESSSGSNESSGDETPQQGGEMVDLGTFVGDPPEHIDPALNTTLDAYQVVNAVYDGLTDIDASDPDNPKIVPQVAESFESNDDATVWTFKIRDGLTFAGGEEIKPSTFQRSWERASNPDFAGDYSYLFNFIQGGAEKLDGTAPTLAGVAVDDDAMTLTVTLAKPYSNFPAVAGFQLFMPVPEEAGTDAATAAGWENGKMFGNGPFMLEAPRTDTEIVLVPNPDWDGTKYTDLDLPEKPYLDKITFQVTADPDTSFNSFEAGEGQTGQIPPGRVTEATEAYANTLDVSILGSYHFDVNLRDPQLGGEDNKLLRKAISQSINRDEINEAVYENSRTVANGVTPEGIPGWKADLCDDCKYDPEQAKADFQEWQDNGGSLSAPIKIQYNTGAGHEDVVAIMVDNLAQTGIDAVEEGIDSETYFSQLADGACVICRAGWFADYPTYDNFMYDLFHTDSLGGNNYGYSNPEFDQLVDQAKQTVDPDEQASLFQQAETILLDDVGVIPIVWYRGDYVYDSDAIGGFTQTNFGLILWEKVFSKQG